jgi:aryl-alcohol dehydrogenase-like predicted oxidoreductase
MDYRLLGRTGVRVSPLCLGTANFADPTPEDESARIVDAAIAAGINLIDTGDSYANGEAERFLGRALAANGRRDDVLIASKMHFPMGPGPNQRDNSYLNVVRACENSLRRLGVDHLDLYQIHRPSETVPVDETLRALDHLVQRGLVRYVGCSTHPAWKVMEALMVSELKGTVRYVSEQPPYNLLDRRIENELVPLCQAHGLAIFPWSPMAMGILAGRYESAAAPPVDSRASLRGGIYAQRVTERGIAVGRRFGELAAAAGLSAAQLAVLWVKSQPGITAPLIGPRSVEQLEHLLPMLDATLPDDIRRACDELVPPGAAVANFHNSARWMKMPVLA